MQPAHPFLKAAAVLCSTILAGAFIAYRSNLFNLPANSSSTAEESTVLNSADTIGKDSSLKETVTMASSKVIILPKPDTKSRQPGRSPLLSSSKSVVVSQPPDVNISRFFKADSNKPSTALADSIRKRRQFRKDSL